MLDFNLVDFGYVTNLITQISLKLNTEKNEAKKRGYDVASFDFELLQAILFLHKS